jgi:hypothetical protein
MNEMNEMNELADLGADVIVNAVNENRTEVVELLLRNGVVAPSSLSDFELSQVVTELLRQSKNFQEEFVEFIGGLMVLNSELEMSGYSNVAGNFFDFSLPPSPFSTNTTTPTSSTAGSTTTTDTTPKTGFTLDKGLNIITQGLNAFLTLDTNKTNRALADASVKTAQSGGTIQNQQIDNTPIKSNTTLYVVLALVGILVVGGGIIYAVKRKNS